MLDTLILVVRVIGLGLIVLGGVATLIASIGFHRFKNFYLRLHAATVGTIWGSVYPLFGLTLLVLTMPELGEYRFFMAGASFVTGLTVLFLSPAGSHALARGVHKSKTARVKPCIADMLDAELCG